MNFGTMGAGFGGLGRGGAGGGPFTLIVNGVLHSSVTFTRGSVGYDYNSSGVLTSFATNIARLGYNPSTLALRGFLSEGARTNIALQSEDFSTTWATNNVTITTNTTIGPDGTQTADTATTSNSSNNLRQAITVTASTGYAFSFFALKGTLVDVKYSVFNNTGASNIIAATSYNSLINASTWTRIEVPFTTPVGCVSANIYPIRDTGVGNGTVILSGGQLEAGAFASSPIPTVGSSVPRAADSASIATSSIPGFSATAGSLLFVGTTAPGAGTQVICQIDDGSEDNRIRLVRDSSNDIRFIVTTATSEVCNINLGSVAALTRFKVAASWSAGDFAASLNGGSVGTDTAGALPTVTTLRIMRSFTGDHFFGWGETLNYYAVALSDAELVSAST